MQKQVFMLPVRYDVHCCGPTCQWQIYTILPRKIVTIYSPWEYIQIPTSIWHNDSSEVRGCDLIGGLNFDGKMIDSIPLEAQKGGNFSAVKVAVRLSGCKHGNYANMSSNECNYTWSPDELFDSYHES